MRGHSTRKGLRLKVRATSVSCERFEDELRPPADDEVVVQVHASSMNYHDYLVMSGASPVADGRIPLSDGAGIVTATGSSVTGLVPGDKVMGTFYPDWLDGPPTPQALANIAGDSVDGFAANFVVMPESYFTRMPDGLSFVEAAIIPCAGVTAWTTLTDCGGVGPGSVVVVEGSGGVAIWCLQLAKSMGAKVIALTSSNEKVAALMELGADLVIDYRSEPDWPSSVLQFTDGVGADLIVEVIGGSNFSKSIAACRMGGRIAAIGFLGDMTTSISIPDLLQQHIRISGRAVGSHADQKELSAYITRSNLRPYIGCHASLSEIEHGEFVQVANSIGKLSISLNL